jgi:hypothetical protein
MAKQFGKSEAELRSAGWSFTRETLAGGADYYYFPVFLISHGVVGPVTGVLHERKTGKALVVQVELRRMCEQFQEFKAALFCTDLAGAVKRLALDLRGVL